MSRHTDRVLRIALVVAALVASVVPAMPAGAAGGGELFRDRPSHGPRDRGARMRSVDLTVDLETHPGPLAVTLNLFDDVSVPVLLHREQELDGSIAWRGRVPGEPGTSVLLVATDGYVFGTVRIDGTTYLLDHAGTGSLTIEEAQPARMDAEPDIPIAPPESTPDATGETGGSTRPATAAEAGTGPVIDIMVVITDDVLAENFSGDPGQARAWAASRIAEFNTALADSQVEARGRLVLTHIASYAETDDIGADLDNLTDPSDGALDEIQTLRNEFGADMVSMVVSTSTSGSGIGWLVCYPGGSPGSTCNSNYLFNVARFDAANAFYTIAHELGHNLGVRHDAGNGGTSHARGYRVPGEFSTIVSYVCTISGGSCVDAYSSRVAFYSNPDVSYGGVPMGSAIGNPDEADAASHIDSVAATVASARSAALCGGQPVTIFGTPGDDHLVGTDGPDVIAGFGGDDEIEGLDGDDILCGGDGADRLWGQAGWDEIHGGGGPDRIWGGGGRDKIYGDAGWDRIWGQWSGDWLYGGPGRDIIYGQHGNDRMWGEGGADSLYGDIGNDVMFGGGGNDEVRGGSGERDRLWGNWGTDEVDGGSGDSDRCRSGETYIDCEDAA